MGLDQYAYTCDPALVKGQVDFEEPEGKVEIAYWRKHPNLQGWMQKLYRAKGGTKDFNCVPVRLEADDLDALEEAVHDYALPEAVGFFFGVSAAEDRDDDLKFIKAAREALAEGKAVFYSSWW